MHLASGCLVLFAFFGVMPVAGKAWASSTGTVSSPVVTKGLGVVEWRTGFSQNKRNARADDRLRSRQHLQYGFTDYYALRLVTQQDKRKEGNFRHQSIGIENHFQWLSAEEDGVDAGFRLNYTAADNAAASDAVSAVALLQIPFENSWQWRHNASLSHDIGAGRAAGVSLEYRSEVSRKITPHLRLAAALFYDIGNLREQAGYQHHAVSIGPKLKGQLGEDFYFQTGYRTGITQASDDHIFQFFIGRKF